VPRPGTDILIVDEAAGGGPVLDTGQAFFVGSSERGPTDRAELVSSSREYDLRYGPRSGGSLLSDAVSAYFAEGGGVLYVSRAIGTGSTPATPWWSPSPTRTWCWSAPPRSPAWTRS
jgi:hypothetical protein